MSSIIRKIDEAFHPEQREFREARTQAQANAPPGTVVLNPPPKDHHEAGGLGQHHGQAGLGQNQGPYGRNEGTGPAYANAGNAPVAYPQAQHAGTGGVAATAGAGYGAQQGHQTNQQDFGGVTNGSLPGPAPNTAGPHRFDLLNKLDPQVDETGGARQNQQLGANELGQGHGQATDLNNLDGSHRGPGSAYAAGLAAGRAERQNNQAQQDIGQGHGLGGHHGHHSHQGFSSSSNTGQESAYAGPQSSGITQAGLGQQGYGNGNPAGPGQNAAGPHRSNLLNKLDPTVSSNNPGQDARFGAGNNPAGYDQQLRHDQGVNDRYHGQQGGHADGHHLGRDAAVAGAAGVAADRAHEHHKHNHETQQERRQGYDERPLPGGAAGSQQYEQGGQASGYGQEQPHGHTHNVGSNTGQAGMNQGYDNVSEQQRGDLPGPAPNTAGPHRHDFMNKLDPSVDSSGGESGLDVNRNQGGYSGNNQYGESHAGVSGQPAQSGQSFGVIGGRDRDSGPNAGPNGPVGPGINPSYPGGETAPSSGPGSAFHSGVGGGNNYSNVPAGEYAARDPGSGRGQQGGVYGQHGDVRLGDPGVTGEDTEKHRGFGELSRQEALMSSRDRA